MFAVRSNGRPKGPRNNKGSSERCETERGRAPEKRAPEACFCRLRSTETRPPGPAKGSRRVASFVVARALTLASVFLLESNPTLGVAAVFLGPPGSDDDWRAYVAALDELNSTVRRDLRPILVQIIRGAAMPNPTMRRELADLRGRIRADVVNVVVSSSPILRNIQTALDWLRKPHYDSTAHPNVTTAFFHLERTLGSEAADRLEILRGLVNQLDKRTR